MQQRLVTEARNLEVALQSKVKDGMFLVTSNMMRLVYAECQLNIPFFSHPRMVELMKANGAQMGIHHADRTGAGRMLSVISNTMHFKLVKHLQSSPGPFSFIGDGSTTYHGEHYFITYIRALEKDVSTEGLVSAIRPVVYFYKLILMDNVDETAGEYMRKIEKSLEEDKAAYGVDLVKIFKDKLLAFGSDGASVMAGAQGGLIKKLETFTNRKIIHVHCMAHRLQLVVGKAFKREHHFTSAENLLSSIHNFYFNRGHKRKIHLEKTAEAMSAVFYRLKQIHKVRWVASEKVALETFLKAYPVLAVDLQDIIANADGKYNPASVSEASGIFRNMVQREAVVYFHFLYDILSSLTMLSEKMQNTIGVLPDISKLILQFQESLIARKSAPGSSETMFLNNYAFCGSTNGNEIEKCASLDQYYTSSTVFWVDQNRAGFKVELPSKSRSSYPDLRVGRESIITVLINKLEGYFPKRDNEVFQVFNPARIPTNEFSVDMYGTNEITKLGEMISLPNTEKQTLLSDWKDLLTKLIDHPGFATRRKAETVDFWSFYLSEDTLPWKPSVKKVIEALLVMPVGSADAERGFSILNHAKYDRRSSLKHASLNAMLRTRINGPPIADFDAFRYAKAWKDTGHMLTDAANRVHNPRSGITEREIEIVDGIESGDYEIDGNTKKYLRGSSLF
ncbi:MAG: hypothetical protein AAF502_25740 [Bacteroidota bacterium]